MIQIEKVSERERESQVNEERVDGWIEIKRERYKERTKEGVRELGEKEKKKERKFVRHSDIIDQLGYNSGHITNPFSPLFYPHRLEYSAPFHLM